MDLHDAARQRTAGYSASSAVELVAGISPGSAAGGAVEVGHRDDAFEQLHRAAGVIGGEVNHLRLRELPAVIVRVGGLVVERSHQGAQLLEAIMGDALEAVV